MWLNSLQIVLLEYVLKQLNSFSVSFLITQDILGLTIQNAVPAWLMGPNA